MNKSKEWIVGKFDQEEINALSKSANIPSMLSRVFLSRGINDPIVINEFLNPEISKLNDPFLLKDMLNAINRISKALESHEKIVIYGDYDVDGITSTSILYNFFTSLNANVTFYIPDRIEEGYGLTIGSIDNILLLEPNLIITVDCGIVSFEEVNYINSKGVEIIITDHHESHGHIPKAVAVINPHQADCTYPFKELSGVGVAFKLIHAYCMFKNLGDKHLEFLDLVAVGTIADVVTLTGENRIIVAEGLKLVSNTKNLGLKALIEVSGIKDKEISSYSVAFAISPRINAAGRLGDPKRAVNLFTSSDYTEVQDISRELNEENKNRQDTELKILEMALLQIESDPAYRDEHVLVVSGHKWHHGVIGIVASRITERYYKPSIVISTENGIGKGSARSIPEFNLFEGLSAFSSLYQRFGGHKAAAGLSLDVQNIEILRKNINEFAKTRLTEYDMIPKIPIDAELNPEEVTQEAIKTLNRMAPFGHENTKPLFLGKSYSIDDIKTVGEKKHLKLTISKNNIRFDTISFNTGSLADDLKIGDVYNFAFYPEINSWNNNEKIQLNLKDLKKNVQAELYSRYYTSFSNVFLKNINKYYEENIVNTDNTLINEMTYNSTEQQYYTSLNEIPCILPQTLIDFANNKQLFILVNTLNAAKSVIETLEENKKINNIHFNICYEAIDPECKSNIKIIVNPDFEKMMPHEYDVIVMAGAMIQSKKLFSFLNNTKINIINCLKLELIDDCLNSIRIDRTDVTSVYKYFSLPGHKKILLNDLAFCAHDISTKFNISINSFKLDNVLQILHELDIIIYKQGEKQNLVTLNDNCAKNELTNSTIFSFLNNMTLINI